MFPNMRDGISEVAYTCLDNQLVAVKQFVAQLVINQKQFINTLHPDFRKGLCRDFISLGHASYLAIEGINLNESMPKEDEYFSDDANSTNNPFASSPRTSVSEKHCHTIGSESARAASMAQL